VKRALATQHSIWFQEKYLQGVVFCTEGQYVAARGSGILYGRPYYLEAYASV
jgi:hypothetical protein